MNLLILLTLGAVGLGILLWRVTGFSVDRDIDHALKTENMDGLLEALLHRPDGAQPTVFNRAIKRLWDDYQRPRAVAFIRTLAERHEEAPIAQYWLNQLQTVEPELAKESLEQGFMERHFNANIAAKCGNAG